MSTKQRGLIDPSTVFTAGISNGEFGLPDHMIPVMARGEGCRLWDRDGKEYLDFSMGWGSCLVGHARPEVVEAVMMQAPMGSNFAYLNEHVLELATEIQRVSPAARRLRFCASGTEATMYCQRIARGFTGKNKILKFEGAYHGANEAGVTSLFASGKVPFPTPELTSAGTPFAAESLLVAPYNDLDAVTEIITEHSGTIAAVLAEPLQRCTPPKPGFLEGLRRVCDEQGVLLIFDEVVTGFRLAYGGAQEYYGVVPDLVAYGKALGGGYPIGVFGGREDIMEMVNEHRIGGDDYVWMASTLGGNPISTAAAAATLSVFRQDGTYTRLHHLGEYLRTGLRGVLRDHQLTAQVIGDGPLAQIVFSSDPVFDYRSTKKGDSAKGRAMMLGLFERGVFLNPMGTKLYLSLAHDEAACDDLCDRVSDTLQLL
ncbi:MAG: aspartate aminotransferase family protein [Rhodospirillales bacterium]|jgi:glutamate-1-semialdehyde 2,1-aminomutase|nr:aspartate aminotransferase family protein [Rhodospirillales bacterium]MBT4625823.1 aspartate aminotransferase family protein [Rhodospirillales bacterium]MBT5351669.1 aspartate aminotransferase family protein [Rhodospirillales bacterium]MBT5520375.1 aspartate aminotransferase family protein [Rhodospirillales bacterium]MBT6111498.1 aspartate aminotransferase family protein [Rhodospirillales bacterium]